MGEVSRPTVAEGFTELTSDCCGIIPEVPPLRMAERSRIRLEIRPITDAAERFQNPAKYGTIGPLKEVNFRHCGRIGKVFRPPLRMAKRSCVRSKSHPIADEEEILENRKFG